MGLLKLLNSLFTPSSPSQPQTSAASRQLSDLPAPPTASHMILPDGAAVEVTGNWEMARYRGRDICDWGDRIAALKRDGNLDEALAIAVGCMDAMTQLALRNPSTVLTHYVHQVCIIQHKMKDYASEVATLQGWLDLGLPVHTEIEIAELRKRLAKAREQLAKSQGEDPTAYTQEWRQWVAREKDLKARSDGTPAVRTGASTQHPELVYRRAKTVGAGSPRSQTSSTSSWIAPARVLAADTFVAVDFETANSSSGASACQVALVRVQGQRVVERYASLVRPPEGLQHFEFTHIHGISARDVATAPSWNELLPSVTGFVGNVPVYAHNAPFDAGVWADLDRYYGNETKPEAFYCSYRTAKALEPGLPNYKLPTVAEALVPGFVLNHHDASSDAEACARIVMALQNRHPLTS